LRRLTPAAAADLIVGSTTGDDAAVYRVNERSAIVLTVDFFTPIVDDARDWGRIAAANALSDVYAMGGRPLLCLNIVGWPIEKLPADLLADVLEGGAAIATHAGAMVVGGHTIDDHEPKYGMAVVGFADPARLMRNDAAAPGDRLFLTKPIGTGVVSTAIKRGTASREAIARVVDLMTTLNADAAEAALAAGIRAATDVTGFGLLGHLQRLLEASGVSGVLWAERVPLLSEARALAAAGIVPGGTRRNIAHLEPVVEYAPEVPADLRVVLADAQTSGGLLMACPPDASATLRSELDARGVLAAEIGTVEVGEAGRIRVIVTPDAP
jgi:selenide,water dikinase